jgi:hypothetical protein
VAAAPRPAQPQQQATRRQQRTPEQKAERASKAREEGLQRQAALRRNAESQGKSIKNLKKSKQDKKAEKKAEQNATRKKKKEEADAREADAKRRKKEKEDAKEEAKRKKDAEEAKKKKEEAKRRKQQQQQSSQRAPSSAASFGAPSMLGAPGGPGLGANSALPPAPPADAPPAAAPPAEDASSSGSADAPTSDGPYSAEEAAVADTVSASDYGLNPDGSIDCSKTPPGEKCPTEEQCRNQALYFIARSNAVANYRRSVLTPIQSFLETLKGGNISIAEHAQKNPDFFTSLGMVVVATGGDTQTQSASTPRVFKGIGEVDAALGAAVKEAIENSKKCEESTQGAAPAQAAGRRTYLHKTRRRRRSRK